MGYLGLLNESEQHAVFSKATTRLWNVHNAMNNFYNEPPFAERLLELTQQGAIPETMQETLVHVVACCAVGNGYGVSNAAVPYYKKIIEGFSPREIATLIRLAMNRHSVLGRRLSSSAAARARLKQALELFDPASIPSGVKTDYDLLMR
nr:hypothetical protein [Vibrio cholerae]